MQYLIIYMIIHLQQLMHFFFLINRIKKIFDLLYKN